MQRLLMWFVKAAFVVFLAAMLYVSVAMLTRDCPDPPVNRLGTLEAYNC